MPDENLILIRLLEQVAADFDLPPSLIRGKKRHSRQVSYAKMLFCWIAWDKYKIPQCDIARFLGWSRTNVHNLLQVAPQNLRYIMSDCPLSFGVFA